MHALWTAHSVIHIREQGQGDSREGGECHLLDKQTHFTLNSQLTCSNNTSETVFLPSEILATQESRRSRRKQGITWWIYESYWMCFSWNISFWISSAFKKYNSNHLLKHYIHSGTNWKPLMWHKPGIVADIVIFARLQCSFDPVCYTSSVLILSRKMCLKGKNHVPSFSNERQISSCCLSLI